jgi:small-conductance mechanosensitive channel
MLPVKAVDMDGQFEALLAEFENIWTALALQSSNLLLPSRLMQFAVLLGCILAAWLLRRWAGRAMRGWMHTLEGRPRWQLRGLVIIERRLGLIFFVVLAWLSTLAVAEITTFPSRRFILELVATIATAWLAISLAARTIRNVVLRKVVTWGVSIYATVYFLGLVGPISGALDAVAIEFGEFRLSLLLLLKALIVTAIFLAAARLLSQTVSNRVRANEDISPSMQVLVVKFLQVILYGAAFFIGLRAVGFDLTGLAVLSGAIGVGLGFGLQKVVSNLVSGIIILLDKSIKPGDVISLGETFGWINSLGARYVSVVTRDGKEYLIPNEDLITGQVVNWSHSNEFVRLDIYFGTSYGDDPHLVRRIAIEAASGVERVLGSRAPVCHIVGFGDSSVDYILRFWITDPTGGLTNIRGNVYLALWDAFKEHGVTIPFPQREVRLLDQPVAVATDGED